MTKQRGLGKGLQEMGLTELLSSINKPAGSGYVGQLVQVDVSTLHPGKYQPRRQFDDASLEELAQSIRSQGVIQPLIVRLSGVNAYEIIAGERRWRASQLAGLKTVPAVIKDMDNEAAMAVGLIENMQREDLNAIDLAEGMERLLNEFSLTHQAIASILGKSRASVTNTLRLLQLDPDLQSLVKMGQLEMGHARSLLALESESRLLAAQSIIANKLSVRSAEELVRNWGSQGDVVPVAKKQVVDDSSVEKAYEEALSKQFGCVVKVSKGKVIFRYQNEAVLDNLATQLLNSAH